MSEEAAQDPPAEAPKHPRAPPKNTVAKILAGLLYGRRPEDELARKHMKEFFQRKSVIAVLASAVTFMGASMLRGDNRTDRLITTIEAQGKAADERNKAMVEALNRSAAAQEDATKTAKVTNGFLATIAEEKTQDIPLDVLRKGKQRQRFVAKPEPRAKP
jgi:hypothetical protein